MDKEALELASAAGAAPLEQAGEKGGGSVHSDLQYVSIQLDGSTYGGWYRLLPDGRMELLALANMHCERRAENTAIEQARGMLADFIRLARGRSKSNGSPAVNEDRRDGTGGTLGDLLYADQAKTRVSEQDWVGLLQSIAASDPLALRELYERAHRVVFTLMVRLTNHRATAEELTLTVFHDVWRRAPNYDAAGGSVLGWILNHARSRAIDHWGLDREAKRKLATPGSGEVLDPEERSGWPTDALRPSEALWERLAERLPLTTLAGAASSRTWRWVEPEWEAVAPGISCKLFATDTDKHRVSMLVRLAPGTDYPGHTHAGMEELHLLHGELLIDDRKLYPGDYNRAEPGSVDKRVWSETGCMCVLLTSTKDVIG